jgi:hypothetical protein
MMILPGNATMLPTIGHHSRFPILGTKYPEAGITTDIATIIGNRRNAACRGVSPCVNWKYNDIKLAGRNPAIPLVVLIRNTKHIFPLKIIFKGNIRDSVVVPKHVAC